MKDGRGAKAALLFGLAAAFLAYISRLTVVSQDLFHMMALFRESLAIGTVPHEDVYAYTPTVSPCIHHEWGFGALLYLTTVTAGLGATGLVLWKYLLTAGTAVGCILSARRRGAGIPVIVALAPVVFAFSWSSFALRPQSATLFFLVCLLLLLEEDRRGHRWWVAVWLPLYVLWLNMHAGFVVGVGLFGFYTIETFIRELARAREFRVALARIAHLLATGVLMIGCLWINPYGTDYIVYLWYGLRLERPMILEWAPLWRSYFPVPTMVFYAVSLGVILYAMLQVGAHRLVGLSFLLLTAIMALKHMRHGSIYAVIWLSYVPAYVQATRLGQAIDEVFRQHRRLWGGVGLAVGCLGVAVATWVGCWQVRMPTDATEKYARWTKVVYPAGAVEYLAEHRFEGNLMVHFGPGSFVSWKLYPRVKVSIDGRFEVAYPEGALEEIMDLYAAKPGWQETLSRYPTDAVLVPRFSRLNAQLLSLAVANGSARAWKRVYRDDGYAVFVRRQLAARLPVVDRRGDRIVATYP